MDWCETLAYTLVFVTEQVWLAVTDCPRHAGRGLSRVKSKCNHPRSGPLWAIPPNEGLRWWNRATPFTTIMANLRSARPEHCTTSTPDRAFYWLLDFSLIFHLAVFYFCSCMRAMKCSIMEEKKDVNVGIRWWFVGFWRAGLTAVKSSHKNHVTCRCII